MSSSRSPRIWGFPRRVNINDNTERERESERLLRTDKQERKDDGQLVDGLADDILHHGARDQRLRAAVRFAQQQIGRRHFGGKGERGECVHDQVHPQHLDGLWRSKQLVVNLLDIYIWFYIFDKYQISIKRIIYLF